MPVLMYFFNCMRSVAVTHNPRAGWGQRSVATSGVWSSKQRVLPTVLSIQAGNNSDDNYAQVLGYSYLFYEAQQSGYLPSWNRLLYGTSSSLGTGYRKNAHLTENVNGIDLVGGWYDAGGKWVALPLMCF